MFSHVHVGIANFERSYAFYAAVMKALGFEQRVCQPQESWAAWAAPGTKRPLFFIGLPYDRQPANSGNGGMTAFLASTREAVDRCHRIALETGGRSEGAPGLRPHYHPTITAPIFAIRTATRFVSAAMSRRPCADAGKCLKDTRSRPITPMEPAMDIAKHAATRPLSISEALHDRVSHAGFDLPRHP